eukprot:9448356-Pyramimonas_sp.AAC.1
MQLRTAYVKTALITASTPNSADTTANSAAFSIQHQIFPQFVFQSDIAIVTDGRDQHRHRHRPCRRHRHFSSLSLFS